MQVWQAQNISLLSFILYDYTTHKYNVLSTEDLTWHCRTIQLEKYFSNKIAKWLVPVASPS